MVLCRRNLLEIHLLELDENPYSAVWNKTVYREVSYQRHTRYGVAVGCHVLQELGTGEDIKLLLG